MGTGFQNNFFKILLEVIKGCFFFQENPVIFLHFPISLKQVVKSVKQVFWQKNAHILLVASVKEISNKA